MSPDYQADYWVRRARLFGWGLILVMALAVVLALGWKIAEVSELRAMDSTRAHLAASLSGLAAEQMAKDRVLDEAWKRKNPFVLLRWRQDNYCGELTAPGEPRAGCWHWLPQQAWVLYRPGSPTDGREGGTSCMPGACRRFPRGCRLRHNPGAPLCPGA